MNRTSENTSISTNCKVIYFEIKENAFVEISENQYKNLGPADRYYRVEYEE